MILSPSILNSNVLFSCCVCCVSTYVRTNVCCSNYTIWIIWQSEIRVKYSRYFVIRSDPEKIRSPKTGASFAGSIWWQFIRKYMHLELWENAFHRKRTCYANHTGAYHCHPHISKINLINAAQYQGATASRQTFRLKYKYKNINRITYNVTISLRS